jgi:hypothetical protein
MRFNWACGISRRIHGIYLGMDSILKSLNSTGFSRLRESYDPAGRIFRIISFLVSGLQPVGPTPRREETKKTPSACGGKEQTP